MKYSSETIKFKTADIPGNYDHQPATAPAEHQQPQGAAAISAPLSNSGTVDSGTSAGTAPQRGVREDNIEPPARRQKCDDAALADEDWETTTFKKLPDLTPPEWSVGDKPPETG